MAAFSEVPVYELGLVAYTSHPTLGCGGREISYVTTVRSAWDTFDLCLVSPQKRKIPDEKHACIDTCVHTEKHICDIFICIYI